MPPHSIRTRVNRRIVSNAKQYSVTAPHTSFKALQGEPSQESSPSSRQSGSSAGSPSFPANSALAAPFPPPDAFSTILFAFEPLISACPLANQKTRQTITTYHVTA